MDSTQHVIQKLILNLNLPNEKSARQIQTQVKDICYKIIIGIIDEVFSKAAGEHSLIRIDKLSIDLGNLDRIYLERDFLERLPSKLYSELDRYFKERSLYEKEKLNHLSTDQFTSSREINIQQLPLNVSHLETIAYFLLHGRLPWWERLGGKDINELLEEQIHVNQREIRNLLRKIIEKPEVQKRIQLQISDKNALLIQDWFPKVVEEMAKAAANKQTKSVIDKSSADFIQNDYKRHYSPINVFAHFLTHGSVPYWGKLADKENLSELLEFLTTSEADGLVSLLQESIKDPIHRKRIVFQFTEEDIEKMIDILANAITGQGQSFVRQLEASDNLLKKENKPQRYLKILEGLVHESQISHDYISLLNAVLKRKDFNNKVSDKQDKISDLNEESDEKESEGDQPAKDDSSLNETPSPINHEQEILSSDNPLADPYDTLHFFFRHGYVPWWGKREEDIELDSLFQKLMDEKSSLAIDLVNELIRSPETRRRMFVQLNKETLSSLLMLKAPQMGGFLETIRLAIRAYYEDGINEKTQLESAIIQWEPIWMALQETLGESPDQSYLQIIIQYLATLLNIPFNEVKTKMLEIVNQAINDGKVRFYPLVDTLETLEERKLEERNNPADEANLSEESIELENKSPYTLFAEEPVNEDVLQYDPSSQEQEEIDASEKKQKERELLDDSPKELEGIKEDTNKDFQEKEKQSEELGNTDDEGSEDRDGNISMPSEMQDHTEKDSDSGTKSDFETESESETESAPVQLTLEQEESVQPEVNENEILSHLERGKAIYPKEVLEAIQRPSFRQKLTQEAYDVAFKRVLEVLSSDDAEIINNYLDNLSTDNPILVAANKEQILLKLADNEIGNIPEQKASQRDTASSMQMRFTLVNEQSIFDTGDIIYVGNAGMVILWPFLRQYFEMLEMLEGSEFKDEATAIRAVHLLQYLTTGKTETPEYELVLNKILCNLPIDIPIPLGIELTEEEEDISTQMMNAILSNWSTIGMGTSVEGLREVFLLREGKLVQDAAGWHLQVAQGSYDMLLDTMPWGISMIKLSWMQEMLYVDWR